MRHIRQQNPLEFQHDSESRGGQAGSNSSSCDTTQENVNTDVVPKKNNKNHVFLLPPRLIVSRGSCHTASNNSSIDSQ